MEQGLKYKVAVVGAGPAGCICSYYLQNKFDISLIDKDLPLRTLLPTGGGRCNLANAQYDFRDLARNYPRGEKFLYSIFSKFSTVDTINFFNKIGVKTYTQYDMRIFPISDSSKDVRLKILNALNRVRILRSEVLKINQINEKYRILTKNESYDVDFVVISIGGHSSFEIIKDLGHRVIDLKPSLTGLKTFENFSAISGVSIDGVLFTHKGISGPKVYELSALHARDEFPYELNFDFCKFDKLQYLMDSNPKKSIKNLLGEYLPKSFVEYVLKDKEIDIDTKCYSISGRTRDKIIDAFKNFKVTVLGTVSDGEIVMSGGVDLKEVNSKTLESRLLNGIYFCGEVLDIDGFCGGFNLQNCWSTGYVVSNSLIAKINDC